jgi:hypothetical protein
MIPTEEAMTRSDTTEEQDTVAVRPQPESPPNADSLAP